MKQTAPKTPRNLLQWYQTLSAKKKGVSDVPKRTFRSTIPCQSKTASFAHSARCTPSDLGEPLVIL